MNTNTEVIIKGFCKCAYYAGTGNYWHKNVNKETTLYRAYNVISFAIYSTMIFLENLAALFGSSLPDVEKNSAVMFAAIHNIVLPKMYLLIYHKDAVKRLNRDMVEVGKKMEEKEVMKKQYRKALFGMGAYVFSVYLSLIAYGVESARRMATENRPFYTVVTYLPQYEDQTFTASFFRVFFYVTWLYMMLPMMSADCFPITHLITLTYKFVTLRHHFVRIKVKFDRDVLVDRKKAEEDLRSEFVVGVIMHQKLMTLANEIHRVFGIIMSLQVCESSAVAVLLLLRLALSPHLDLTNAFMTYTFVSSLFLLLALNLWNAGEVTYQASLLSNAMFGCGWNLCQMDPAHQAGRDLRKLVLIGCTQAQKPLILKAFGMQDLSYETFVSVAKMTYSIFAVFYQRGE